MDSTTLGVLHPTQKSLGFVNMDKSPKEISMKVETVLTEVL
ncbi:MAG: hypothetical protein ACTSWA_10250 [Candidatus Thorarchaeota archaeon]